jgi:hypothetical protein
MNQEREKWATRLSSDFQLSKEICSLYKHARSEKHSLINAKRNTQQD